MCLLTHLHPCPTYGTSCCITTLWRAFDAIEDATHSETGIGIGRCDLSGQHFLGGADDTFIDHHRPHWADCVGVFHGDGDRATGINDHEEHCAIEKAVRLAQRQHRRNTDPIDARSWHANAPRLGHGCVDGEICPGTLGWAIEQLATIEQLPG